MDSDINNDIELLKAWQKFEVTLAEQNTNDMSYRQGEIWWVAVGHNIGDEEDGKGDAFTRPVLIVRGFSEHLFWGVPLSSQLKQGEFYHQFQFDGKLSTAILSQMRTYDTRRLISFQGKINDRDYEVIKAKLINIIRDDPRMIA